MELIEQLPPSQGAINEHTHRAHMQANIWQQTLVPEPIELDPVTLGWTKDATGGLMLL